MRFTLKVDEDVELLLWRPCDAEALYAVVDANREHIGRWMPWPAVTHSADDQRRWIVQNLKGFAATGRAALGIVEQGVIVGGIGNDAELSWPGCIEIGYWLAADAQGRGLVTRCCRALIDDAFAGGAVHRVNIRAEPENTRSCAVAERLGFTCEGTLRHVCRFDGRWIDHRLYALLKEQWGTQ